MHPSFSYFPSQYNSFVSTRGQSGASFEGDWGPPPPPQGKKKKRKKRKKERKRERKKKKKERKKGTMNNVNYITYKVLFFSIFQ